MTSILDTDTSKIKLELNPGICGLLDELQHILDDKIGPSKNIEEATTKSLSGSEDESIKSTATVKLMT